MRFEDLPKQWQDQVRYQDSRTAANMEQHPRNEPGKAHEGKTLDPPVYVHVHSIRHRLADSDGISVKWCLDAIVEAGILKDDSPDIVKRVTFSQEKGDPEETIITVEEY